MSKLIKQILLLFILINVTTVCGACYKFEEKWKMNCEKFYAWKAAGVKTPLEAKKWINIGVDWDQIEHWSAVDIEEASEWKKLFADNDTFTAHHIMRWKKRGVNKASVAREWKDAGLDSYYGTIKEWKAVGVNTPTDLKNWESIGVRKVERVENYKRQGLDYNEIKKWHDIGVSASSVASWKKINLNYVEAKKWVEAGFNHRDVVKLIKVGCKTAQQCSVYKKINSLEHKKILIELNIKPTKFIESLSSLDNYFGRSSQKLFFSSKEDFSNRLKKLKKNGCKKIENDRFAKADPYENDGLCYLFKGRLSQRLDRHTGLAVGSKNKPMFMEFNFSWNEGNVAYGVVKGMGEYKYETVAGVNKIIPKGKVLFP